MNVLKIILLVIMILWYIFYILFNVYLYINDSKMHNYEYDVDVKNIDRTSEDLSLIMYKKIKVEVFISHIVHLINTGFIKIKREENDFILVNMDKDGASKSDSVILDTLFNIIGNQKEVSLKKVETFCNKQAKCSIFLMNYQIWKRLVIVESHRKDLFEPKMEYGMVKFFKTSGIILFILNILLKYYSILGFFIIVPSLFISIYFYNISKLTNEYTQEYYGWLKFRRDIINKQVVVDNKYLEYTVILRCFDSVENSNQKEFVQKLDYAIKRCYTKAMLNGNRSLFGK